MIQHVWEGAIASKLSEKVLVATDDDRIERTVRDFGGEVCMTADSHRNGTERVAELAAGLDFDIVLNLQGDLPLFDPEVLDQMIASSIKWIGDGEADMVTAKAEMTSDAEIFSPNTVKVVTDNKGRALYFSRSPIPYIQKEGFAGREETAKCYKHYGIYCYERNFLLKIVKAPEGVLERTEKLEQLRVLEQGGRIGVIELEASAAASFLEVNTPDDLEKAREMLAR